MDKQANAFALLHRQRARPLNAFERLENPDGSFSTELTITEEMPDGSIANIPTLWNIGGEYVELPWHEAIQMASQFERQMRMTFPRFKSVEEAVQAAVGRSQSGGAQGAQNALAGLAIRMKP